MEPSPVYMIETIAMMTGTGRLVHELLSVPASALSTFFNGRRTGFNNDTNKRLVVFPILQRQKTAVDTFSQNDSR